MFVYFPAIFGRQGEFNYYSVQVPFASIGASFVFDDTDLPIEMRCQREINLPRARKFANYINSNPSNFVTGAVVGTVDDNVEFIPIDGPFTNGEVGMLKIPATHRIILCDGQHRQKGIEMAMEDDSGMHSANTLPIILYAADGNERKQQIFSDINTNAVKPSSSLAITFDHRSNFLGFVKSITKEIPYLSTVIEFERSSVSPKSTRLWPLVSFKSFIVNLTGLTEKSFDDKIADENSKAMLKNIIVNFIKGLDNLPLWKDVTLKKVNISEVRQDTIVAHAVFLEALGIYGSQLMQHFDAIGAIDWTLMAKLSNVQIAKSEWIGRCVSPQMTINKNQYGIKSTAAKICNLTDTPLNAALADIESKFI